MDKQTTINIDFNLDNMNAVVECDTNDEQPEKDHYRKIQETEEGQNLILELVNVINSIGNIEKFTKTLKCYVTKYAILKQTYPNINFKIGDIKFDCDDGKQCTLTDIIRLSFSSKNGVANDNLINLYNGIINQFDKICIDLDSVFNIQYNLNNFERFMNDLSLKTMSPLTIELVSNIIDKRINKIASNLSRQATVDKKKLKDCKDKFTNLQNGTQVVKKDLRMLSKGNTDTAFEEYKDKFKKDNNYLSLVKDEYGRNYLHYAWNHFEGALSKSSTLSNIKARLKEYANGHVENIKQAYQERDVYGLTPLCCVLIDAFDGGITNQNVKNKLGCILGYFKELNVTIELSKKDLQAIYDYFQITKDVRVQQRNYEDFIKAINGYFNENKMAIHYEMDIN